MASGNKPGGVPLIKTKIQELLKRIDRMSMKCINVIIRSFIINLGLLAGSFQQKVRFLVKIDSENQTDDVFLILTKNPKLLKRVNRIVIKYIKVIIKDYLSILVYQMDHFVQKTTFWSKWPPEISPVASP